MATVTENVKARAAQASRGVLHSLMGVQLVSTGAFVPETVVRNEDLAALGYDAPWIVQRTGIHQRRHAPPHVATSDLAARAAQRCLAKAGVPASDIDLLLVATVTPDTAMPAAACHLQRRLGARAPAMDINAACSGFVFALVTAAHYLKNGFGRLALVVGADTMSRTVDPADKRTYPLFGDGAGAVLVGAGDRQQGFVSYTLGCEGEGTDLLYIAVEGSREPASAEPRASRRPYLRMAGRAVFKWAVRTVVDSILDVLCHAGLTPNDLDLVALHQANRRIIEAVVDDLGIDRRRVLTNVDRYGNTSAASIPLVLEEAQAQGRIRRGDLVLISGFGAGLTWGTAVIRW